MKDFYIGNFASGCVESDNDLRDYRLNNNIAMVLQLPEEFEVEHSPIKNQGGVCSCVAHSVAEVLEAINNNEEKYSTNWIYGYRPGGYYQKKGMLPRQAIKTACKVGYILYDDFKGNDEMNTVKHTVDNNIKFLKEKASERKTYSYALLKNRNEIKRAIFLTKHPIVIAVHCCDPFIVDENNILVYSDKFQGYHCMVCYGWNKDGLLIQNSWGETWGNKGTCILPENYPYSEAWLVADTTDEYMIVKPKMYFIRKIVQSIVNSFKKVFE